MSISLLVHPALWADVTRVRDWYGEISPRLVDEFSAELVGVIDRIQEYPRLYAEVEGGYRRANLPRFPYQVFYHLTPSLVWILAVFPDRADPQATLARLAGRTILG